MSAAAWLAMANAPIVLAPMPALVRLTAAEVKALCEAVERLRPRRRR